ncbi:hypothetical protein C7212DRAFT_164354, partial [Tuber magnatum]
VIQCVSCTFVTGSTCESRVGSVRVRSWCRVQKRGKEGRRSLRGRINVGWLDSAMQVRVIDSEDWFF